MPANSAAACAGPCCWPPPPPNFCENAFIPPLLPPLLLPLAALDAALLAFLLAPPRTNGRMVGIQGKGCAEIWHEQTEISAGAHDTAAGQSRQYASSNVLRFVLPVSTQAWTSVLSKREASGFSVGGCWMTDRHCRSADAATGNSVRAQTLLRVPET